VLDLGVYYRDKKVVVSLCVFRANFVLGVQDETLQSASETVFSSRNQGRQSVSEVQYIDKSVPEERYDLFCEAALWKNAFSKPGKLKVVTNSECLRLCCIHLRYAACRQTLARIA
jgi:trehalose-6-phosphate synthase